VSGQAITPLQKAANISVVLVAAVADNGVIGKGGGLPWRLKSDLTHFRMTTVGKPVVMGRKTYISIGKPLKGRTNIVVTRDSSFGMPGVLVVQNLDAALVAARGDAMRRGANEIAVIGGAEIYAQILTRADRIVMTRVHLSPTGDTMFPTLDPAAWSESERRDFRPGPGDEAPFTLLIYDRLPASNRSDG
jgi:dihydrofolate reductase